MGGKIVKKKIILLFLLVLSLFTVVSCNTNSTNNSGSSEASTSASAPAASASSSAIASSSTILHEEPWRQGKTIIGNPIVVNLTDAELTSLEATKESGLDKVTNETDYEGFEEIYNSMNKMYYKISEAMNKYELDFYVYGRAADLEKKDELNDIRVDLVNWFNEVEHLAFNNSFKAKFYEGMTDEEILEKIGEDYDDEFFDLSKELSRIQSEADNLSSNDKQYNTKIENIFIDFNRVSTAYANKLGYDDYMDYAYPNAYSRDFTPEDTDKFFEYVNKYVITAYKLANNELNKVQKKLTTEEKKIYNSLMKDDVFLGDFELIEDYVGSVGGIMKEEFDKLFCEGGNYFISYEAGGYGLAFETDYYNTTLEKSVPLVFYGPGYHNATTVVHEFGHYLANTQDFSSSLCYDLAETHSQANEFLFLEYVCSHKDYSDNLKKAIMLNQYVDAYRTIVIASFVNEVEKIITREEYKSGDIAKAVQTVLAKSNDEITTIYSATNFERYVKLVGITSSCYYISYATSLFGSLYIDKLSQTNWDGAVDAYFKLIENQNGYREAYTKAGLKDPFTEEAFQFIFA